LATKLYLHREGVGTLPTGTLPSSEQSTLTADANLFDNEDGSENRSMNTTVSGSAQTSLTNTSTGDTNAHNYYIARWVSPVLNQTSVAANTWTVEFAASEGNAAANFPRSGAGVMYVNAYVWKPSNGTKYGTILDGNSNADGEEAGTTQTVISYTFSGAAVNSLTSGDACIVFEMWAQVTQANGTARAQTVFYDGTTENSTSNEAAFISTPENLSFSTAYTRSIATETVSTSDSLGRTYNAIRKPSTSLSFDGNEDRANLGNHSGLWSQALSKFSFSCWIYAKTISNSSFRSVFIHAPSGFANATDCYINSASTLYFDMNDTGAAHLATATNSAFNTTNKWYHIVGTYDNSLAQNSRIQLYVDNVVGTSNDNGSFSPNGSADMLLGDDDQAASATTSWDGYIKDFRWFNNKVLNSTERTDIRNNSSSAPTPDYWLPMHEGTGTPVDVIGGKTTSFVNNTTWGSGGEPFSDFIKVSDSLISVKGQSRKAGTGFSIVLDGNGDYVDLGAQTSLWSQSLTKFSFSCWFYPTTLYDKNRQGITITDGNDSFALQFRTDLGYVSFILTKDNYLTYGLAQKGGSALETNKWYHIVCTYDNSLGSANVKIYVDKVLGTSVTDYTFALAVASTEQLYLGRYEPTSTDEFAGNIKDFRWFNNKELTQTEINNIYDNSSSSPTPDYWLKMREGTGTPVDSIGANTTTFAGNTTWSNQCPDSLIYESTTSSESLSRMTAATRAIPETTSIGETLLRMLSANRPLSTETVTVSENLQRTRGAVAVLATQTVTVGETLNRMLAATRSLPETTSSGESIARMLGASRTLPETTSMGDTVSRKLEASRTLQDTTAVSDNLTRLLSANRALATEVTAISDSLNRLVANTRSLPENTAVSDSLTKMLAASRTLATETVTINEQLQRLLAATRTLQDTTSIIEDLDTEFTSGGGGAQNYNRSITEDTSISESLERMLVATRILNTETTSISDDLNRMLAANRAIASESTPIGEILQRLLAASVYLQESVTTNDTLQRLVNAFRTLQDNITSSDSINRTYSASRPIQEDVSIIDSLSLRLSAFRTLIENTSVSDLLEYLKHSIGNQDYIVNLIENVLITDNIRTWLSPLKIFKSLKGNFRSEGVRTESQGRKMRPAGWFRSSFYTNERTRNPKRNSESEGQ